MSASTSQAFSPLLTSNAPANSPSEAAEIARLYFGVTASARLLSSERDQNFHLSGSDGREYVLKITNSAEDPAVTNLQTQALLHIARTNPAFPVPRLFQAKDGKEEATLELADGTTSIVRLLSYLHGEPLHKAAGSTARIRQLAGCLAELDLALRDYRHPAADHELLWDLKQAARLRDILIHIADTDRRALATRFLDAFETHALPVLAGLRAQVIHNDFNPHNVLVDAKDPDRVTGILDFGDIVHAPLINDVAIGACYQLAHPRGALAALAEFAAGYHAVVPLTEAEIDILFDLVAARQVMTVAITEWRASRYPANRAYIMRNNPRAWTGLESFAPLSRDEAREVLRRACGMEPKMSTPAFNAGMINAFVPGKSSELSAQDAALIARREKLLGPAYRLFYADPVHIVRGEGVWLYDPDGQAYLDVYNNVASVGHCHPHVLQALTRQAAILNTHTRYLHETILDYAEKLLATFPPALAHVMFTCTGSEANDLALRIAEAYTGGIGVIVTSLAYHGITRAVAAMSPSLGQYSKLGEHVRTVPAPDLYRSGGRDVGATFAANVRQAIADMKAHGIKLAAFYCDTIFSSDGVLSDPPGFLAEAVDVVRAEGGLFVADEVQPGFGRTGTHMWGFLRHDVAPDMVTIGKPMGNGQPIAGVVTRPELVEEFGRRARYFNTFGGNPVSCAAGLAVLEVIEREGLMNNAHAVGIHLRDGLRQLADRHAVIGDVRGAGLFIGVELVRDRATKEPDPETTARLVNGLRERRILISAAGPGANVLKIRPPLVFTKANADLFLEAVDAVLSTS